MGRTRQTARIQKGKGGKGLQLNRRRPQKRKLQTTHFIDDGDEDEIEDYHCKRVNEMEKEALEYKVSYDSAFFAHYFAAKEKKPTQNSGGEQFEDENDITPLTTFLSIKRDPRTSYIPSHSLSNFQNAKNGEDVIEGNSEEHWLGINFATKYDGNGIKKYKRVDLNLIITLDISGSMDCAFRESLTSDNLNHASNNNKNEDVKSKLEVAKKCIISLFDQLKDDDYLGIEVFNTSTNTLLHLTKWNEINKNDLISKISKLRPTGGTNLTKAIKKSSTHLNKGIEGDNRYSRVLFLTDMEEQISGDEENFMVELTNMSKKNQFTTVIGVGCDLSSKAIIHSSKLAGCNYCNVMSNQDFENMMSREFDYLVTPAAFNVQFYIENSLHYTSRDSELLRMDNNGEWRIQNGYGSPEVTFSTFNPVQLSTIFPTHRNANGEYQSGFYLFKLNHSPLQTCNLLPDQSSEASVLPESLHPSPSSSSFTLKMKWENQSGISNELEETIHTLQNNLSNIEKLSITKAVLLVQYTDFITNYLHDYNESLNSFDIQNLESIHLQIEKNSFRKKQLLSFLQYFDETSKVINDPSLLIERSVLSFVLNEENKPSSLEKYATAQSPSKKVCSEGSIDQ